MSYTEQEFISMVKQAEQDAAQDITGYKRKLAMFALLGYLVIFSVLTLLIALAGGTLLLGLVSSSLLLLLIKKKFIIAIVLAIWTFLRALWVKFDPPSGYTITRKDCPRLFGEIDQLSETLNALKIHQVILDNRLNAAVVQHPRFGILGGQKNTLFLGIQLMLAMSPEQMRSVLAHEMGHLSGNHSQFSGWIYRVRTSWMRIVDGLESNNSFGARMMHKFFDWYAPRFSAYSFALARSNEYEADHIATQLTSPNIAAQALVNVHATAPYIDQSYWRQYFDQADVMQEPPYQPFQGLADFLKQSPIERHTLLQLIDDELKEETDYSDTHPSLKDRLKAIDSDDHLPDSFEHNAAEIWLGENYQEVLTHFDNIWLDNNKEDWRNRYQYVTQAKQALETFAQKDMYTLTDEELWDYACYTDEFLNADQALELFKTYVDRNPNGIGAAYHAGRILTDKNDLAALPYLRTALQSLDTIEDAAQWGYDLLKEQATEKEADDWWEKANQVFHEKQAAIKEREALSIHDSFSKLTISEDQRQNFINMLQESSYIQSAWIAQKVLEHQPEDPVYTIAVKKKLLCFKSYSDIVDIILENNEFEQRTFLVPFYDDAKDIAKDIKKLGDQLL